MTIYWILLIWIVLIGGLLCGKKRSKKNDVYFLFLAFGVFFLVQACRAYSVGIDTNAYVAIFYRTKDLPFSMYPYNDLEWGYLFLNKLVGYCTNNPQWLLTVVSAIVCLGIAYFIYKNASNPFWPTFLYLCMNYFFTSMVSLRQYIAIALVVNAFQCAKQRKYLWVGILSIIAAFFHYSALFGVLCIIISTLWTPGRKTIFASAVMVAIAYIFLPQIIQLALQMFPKYQYYIGSELFQQNTLGEYTLMILLFEIGAVGLLWLKKTNTSGDLPSITMIIVMAIGINLMKTQVALLWRLGYYTDIFLVIFIPELLRQLTGKKLLYYYGILIGGCALYAYFMTIDASRIVPYIAFWRT